MTEYDLCSAVFVIHSDRRLPTGRFLGRAANKLFFEMLNHATGTRTISDILHNQDSALPYSVSDLFHASDDFYWFRITGLEPSMCLLVKNLAEQLRGQTVIVPPRPNTDDVPWQVKIESGMLSQQMTYRELVQSAWRKPSGYTLTLNFVTETVLESIGVYRPFPEPALVFKLLYERLLKLQGIELRFKPEVAALEAFADYFVGVSDYQIKCAPLSIKQAPEIAFCGQITYKLLCENDAFRKRAETRRDRDNDASLLTIHDHIVGHYDEYACLLNLLSAFAFYSGVGKETGQGKGMVRKVETHG